MESDGEGPGSETGRSVGTVQRQEKTGPSREALRASERAQVQLEGVGQARGLVDSRRDQEGEMWWV